MSEHQPLYFSGQGSFYTAKLDADGNPLGFRFMGSVSDLKLEPKATFIEHTEDYTGTRGTDARIPDKQDLEYSFTLDDASMDNYAEMFYGTKVVDTAETATFSGVALPLVLEAGYKYRFGKTGYKITAMTDSGATPKTVPASAYTVGTGGTVSLKDVTVAGNTATIGGVSYTLPLLVAGDTAATSTVGIMSKRSNNVALMFEGINTFNGLACTILIHKGSNDPVQSYDVISGGKFSQAQIKGKALVKVNAESDELLGRYGFIEAAIAE